MLKGKTALITGASGGLGTSIALALAAKGCNLVLCGRNIANLKNLKNHISDVDVQIAPGDLKDWSYVKHLTLYDVDILVNNAGIFPIKTLAESTDQDYKDCFAVNVYAPFVLSRDLGRKMTQQRWGRIVNIGSSSSYNGSGETGLYCASKHALLGLSRSLFQEYRDSGVRVYSVSPGSIQTPMGATDTRQDYSTFINPDEVAEYVGFILSYENEMISEEIRLNRWEIR
jgi:short-subunit dehydrogenase|tara:strand:- start:32 stop:715 length:684 start_codon:yes stop_codon:yes gene_type:complete